MEFQCCECWCLTMRRCFLKQSQDFRQLSWVKLFLLSQDYESCHLYVKSLPSWGSRSLLDGTDAKLLVNRNGFLYYNHLGQTTTKVSLTSYLSVSVNTFKLIVFTEMSAFSGLSTWEEKVTSFKRSDLLADRTRSWYFKEMKNGSNLRLSYNILISSKSSQVSMNFGGHCIIRYPAMLIWMSYPNSKTFLIWHRSLE